MDQEFKKARIITIAMMLAIFLYGIVAWFLSDRSGYGASSEGKMNFLRMVVFFVSAMQMILAFAIHKTMRTLPKNSDSGQRVTLQMIINAFCEAIALFGLVLFFMSKNFIDYVFFAFLSLAAFSFFFPKTENWIKENKAAQPFDSKAGM